MLGRRLLMLPLHRYVDDFFACEREESCEHALLCFKRLVRACLGSASVADAKCESGNPLTILGVEVCIIHEGVRFKPALAKVQKWAKRIASYLEGDRLTGGEAAKLAGALQWASQHAFKRLGRAMIRPIHRCVASQHGRARRVCGCFACRQKHSWGSRLNAELRLALQWWLEVLDLKIVQIRPWVGTQRQPVHLYTDARSTPPRVAAVLVRCVGFACICWRCQSGCDMTCAGMANSTTATQHLRTQSCSHSRSAAITRLCVWRY